MLLDVRIIWANVAIARLGIHLDAGKIGIARIGIDRVLMVHNTAASPHIGPDVTAVENMAER
jgi:hypothetical protein